MDETNSVSYVPRRTHVSSLGDGTSRKNHSIHFVVGNRSERTAASVMEIYGVNMSRLLRTDEFNHMMNSVSEERRAKVQSFIKPEDANRGLLGDVLIRSVICSKLNIKHKEIHFTAEPNGKP